ncbi:MarR family winged helix-turn-helix transcriptional regulator [Mycobacteroides abscessus]|uniref:MarR family winged helix-turn-helix transcriptional regulator n=1 Tax=Mycobacteroides abscessus TaxID=36809 RepID=UPI0002EA0C89|nr:MarR family transcriptional regulator [Mycobacteroides abscessus]MDO3031634.1 MarR family transcriptional regulator [Mycobacteroides abscessus subsp. massiliense]TKV37707.1 MarR family transcriptional regulator [Mycobacteroides abscessus subsp. bolletii]SKK93149.1 transcriptional regulator [Mycobacteroides abscessus subsp. massiliense]
MNKSDNGMDRIAESVRQAALLAMRNFLNRDELSVSAMEVLHTLSVEGPTRLTALCEAIHLSQPAMTQLIQRLERRDLVARVADPEDGRATIVDVTEHARDLLCRLRNEDAKKLATLLATLSEGDQEALRLAMYVAGPIIQRLNENAALLALATTEPSDEQTNRINRPRDRTHSPVAAVVGPVSPNGDTLRGEQ